MPIVYALISRGKTVLAEYTSTSGNFPTVTRVLLSKIPTENSKMSYVYDKFVTHLLRTSQPLIHPSFSVGMYFITSWRTLSHTFAWPTKILSEEYLSRF
jgi:hypothetical protein